MTTYDDVFELAKTKVKDWTREHNIVIALDLDKKVIFSVVAALGDETSVCLNEDYIVDLPNCIKSTKYIIVCHNHNSGALPSDGDILITQSLSQLIEENTKATLLYVMVLTQDKYSIIPIESELYKTAKEQFELKWRN